MNTRAKRPLPVSEPPAFRGPRARRLLDKAKLGRREMEVCLLRARGWTYKEISKLTGTRARTVEQQVYNVKNKFQRLGCYRFGVGDFTALFLMAGAIRIEDLKFRNDNEI